MRPNTIKQWLPALLLTLLLILLATLQYRWIGEVSRAEKDRLRQSIRQTAVAASQTYDEEVSSLLFSVGLVPPGLLAESLATWRAQSRTPKLLSEVLQIRMPRSKQAPQGPPKPEPILERFNEIDGRFEPIEWTTARRPLLRFLKTNRIQPGRPGADRFRESLGEMEPTLPAIVVRTNRQRRRSFAPQVARVLFLVLDRDVLEQEVRNTLFPQLKEALGEQFSFRVVDHDGRRIATSVASWPDDGESFRFALLRLRPPEDLRQRFTQRILERYRAQGLPAPEWTRARRTPGQAREGAGPPGVWSLEIVHRRGTLEQAVLRTRLRNLGISAAILGLLAATVIYLLRSANRDRQLAERQLDFVAGLTHELHTPLAAITSAGANLADGVVAEPKRVREYGEMLKKEGGRLNDLVGQALHLAGIESRKRPSLGESFELSDLLNEAMDRCRLMAKEANTRISHHAPEAPVGLSGDREDLVRALTNILGNAIKHGATEVTLTTRTGGGKVFIRIEDNGPGIHRKNAQRLFEPYARGPNTSTPGAGLGLYLARRIAEQHGGTLRFLPSTPRQSGATFELSLPIA